ncbi:1-phosphofructokinase family hexose kinase [Treponema sp.]|uniref:1-phosphofructokinase family hexose kinase n=1 Tax=Treponema sp. TaxID=166 RepID=UPI00388FDF02
MKILCVCLSPTIQRTITFDSFNTGKVNRSQIWREDASGKALNAARVLNQLEPGSSVALCPVGNANAEHFMILASNDTNLYVTPIYIEGNTRECWTILDKTGKTTTEVISDELQNPLHIAGAEAELKLLEFVRKDMMVCDALLFAGSRPSNWSANICGRICDVAKKAGKTILADFRGEDLLTTLKVCTPDIIKLNETEFCQTFIGKSLSEDELVSEISKKSAELKNIIVVTRGTKDTLSADNGKAYRTPIENITAINTTGCGDTFDAGFLNNYLNNKDMESALKAGTHCAALNAQTIVPGSINL